MYAVTIFILNSMKCDFNLHPLCSEDSEMLVDPLIETEAERLVKNPSPSIVPRIHAVFVQKLDINNPLVPRTSTGLNIPLGKEYTNKYI